MTLKFDKYIVIFIKYYYFNFNITPTCSVYFTLYYLLYFQLAILYIAVGQVGPYSVATKPIYVCACTTKYTYVPTHICTTVHNSFYIYFIIYLQSAYSYIYLYIYKNIYFFLRVLVCYITYIIIYRGVPLGLDTGGKLLKK